jgi:signal transduction histidine kinase
MEAPKILIVDDEPANLFLLSGLLKANGYQTYTADSGQKCIDFLESHLPDLILLDIMMPKMTGTEVLEKISQSEIYRNIPVIMVTAKSSAEDVSESLEKGALDYIKKPFNETELIARVKVGIRLKLNEDKLRNMIEQRNSFVKIISHDLRSPFTTIHGFAELLIQNENLTLEQKEFLNFIIDSIQYSNNYFNKLLDWTMLESSDISLTIISVNLSKLVDVVCKIFNKNILDKSIQLNINIPDEFTVNVDDTFFRQVLANLINNALKFTPEHGTIEISASKSDKIYLSIADSGIGLPEGMTNEELFSGKILESHRGTSGEKGTGIGLSICKKIIDAHRFNIYFKRLENNGTAFIIEI